MPLAPPSYTRFDERLCENSRMFLVGVRHYEHFNGQCVESAHNNILSWFIQGLRMGLSPHGNHILVDATPEEVQRITEEVLIEADLTDPVRSHGRISTDGWFNVQGEGSRWDDWGLGAPTFQSILGSLIDLANHLHWCKTLHAQNEDAALKRLLVVFSGHGALSQGTFVLCPSDAMLASQAPPTDLAARQRQLNDRHPRHQAALQTAFQAAERRGVLAELLDVLESSEIPFFSYLNLEVITQNLRRLKGSAAGSGSPDFVRVIGPVHLQLILGDLGDHVTLVLDACHAGGGDTALQGSEAIGDWTARGLPCRILSASRKSQRAAEATLGQRRYSAATWALTHVLSRWEPVADGEAYAMGITHGNLVLRANLLLDALSFNQQISLSGPPSKPRLADLPFFGQHAHTPTTVDPNGDASGIQLDSGAPMLWEIRTNGTLQALLFVADDSGTHKLHVLGTASSVANLPGASFTCTMISTQSTTVSAVIATYSGQLQGISALASVDAAPATEPAYSGPASPAGFVSYQKPSGPRRVWMKWLAAAAPNPAKLIFVLNSNTAYGTGDFQQDTAVTFDGQTTPSFDSTWKKAEIALG